VTLTFDLLTQNLISSPLFPTASHLSYKFVEILTSGLQDPRQNVVVYARKLTYNDEVPCPQNLGAAAVAN